MLIQQANLEDVPAILALLSANHVNNVENKVDGFVTTSMTASGELCSRRLGLSTAVSAAAGAVLETRQRVRRSGGCDLRLCLLHSGLLCLQEPGVWSECIYPSGDPVRPPDGRGKSGDPETAPGCGTGVVRKNIRPRLCA